MKKEIKHVASKLKKASKAHAKQSKILSNIVKRKEAANGGYIGSYISGDLAGKHVANPHLRKYYKGLL